MRRLLFVLVLMALSSAAAAKLYKWVDKDGNVTYSELKPPDAKAEEIELRGVPSVSNEEAKARLEALSGKAKEEKKDREFKQNYASETAEREARMKENCKTARSNLAALQQGGQKRYLLPNGEVRYLSEEDRVKRIEEAESQIKQFCAEE